MSTKPRMRVLSLRSWLGIVGLVALAGSLVFIAWRARTAALDNAHVALQARISDRLHYSGFIFRFIEDPEQTTQAWMSSDLLDQMGWRWVLSAEGEVIASTRHEDLGQQVGLPILDGMQSSMRLVQSADVLAFEVCMPSPRPLLERSGTPWGAPPFPPLAPPPEAAERSPFGSKSPAPLFPPRAPPPEALLTTANEYLCTLTEATGGLEGADAANLHFHVSVAFALGLLALAIYVVTDGLRTSRLHVGRAERAHLVELGQLAGVLAHEIRTPLAALRGYAQLLDERTDDSFAERALVVRMVEQTTRVAHFVDDLVTFARPAPPRFVEFDLANAIGHALERAHTSAGPADVRLISECPQRMPILADPHRIDAMLDNLLSNAIQASPRGEVVTVTARSSGDMVTIDVRDRGQGVPVEERERIFEPFFTTRSAGTGLGLALTLKGAREHGGNMSVVDPSSGPGIIIRVTLAKQGPS